MTQDRTVFVVGAGASHEFGLPTGRGLLEKIHSTCRLEVGQDYTRFSVPPEVESAFRAIAQTSPNSSQKLISLMKSAVWISENAPLAPSIDNLLHSHQGEEDIVSAGKVLISYCLLKSENASTLMKTGNGQAPEFLYKKKINGRGAIESWLARLFWLLAEESTFHEFKQRLSRMDFISFNYDRCIAQFIVTAATSYFRLDASAANALLNSLSILHPYGSLGDLEVGPEGLVGFGKDTELSKVYSRLKTFTEGSEEGNLSQIRSKLGSANKVFFMGFGFLNLNLDLLLKSTFFERKPEVFGTALNISDHSTKEISQKLGTMIGWGQRKFLEMRGQISPFRPAPVDLVNMGCADLMDHFHFHLRR